MKAAWSEYEVATLNRIYRADMPIEEKAKILGRTVKSIYRKAEEIGIKKPTTPGRLDLRLELHMHDVSKVVPIILPSLADRTVKKKRKALRDRYQLDRLKDAERYAIYLVIPSKANT